MNVFPPGLLMRPIIIPVHEYADAMLEYFAKKGNESKESVLGVGVPLTEVTPSKVGKRRR